MSDSSQKLQRLLAQQRAIAAQIKSIEDRERERKERSIALIIRRHKLDRFEPEKIEQALAIAIAALEGAAQQQPAPQVPESAHGG